MLRKRCMSLVRVVLLLSLFLPTVPVMAQSAEPDTPPVPADLNPVYLPFVATQQTDAAPAPELPATEVEEESVVNLEDVWEESNTPKPESAQDGPVDPAAVVPPEPSKPEVDEAGIAAASEIDATDGWSTVLSETFEGAWPNSRWTTWDANGSSYGNYYWDDESYMAYSGYWSGWPVGNALSPHTSNYPNNAYSWAKYGPFSLSGATAATFSFNLWNQSETNYDFIGWYVSTNGSNFYGSRTSGSTGGWTTKSMNLANVPSLGSVLGRSQVWIAFIFRSDSSVTYKGPFIDNVTVRKNVEPCPNSLYAQYYSGIFTTLRGTACEPYFIHHEWGYGNPSYSGMPSDRFSARYTGSVPFAGGWYTFALTGDDGVRLWIDNTVLISAWYHQVPTTYYASVYLTPGRHTMRVDYYEDVGSTYLDLTWYR